MTRLKGLSNPFSNTLHLDIWKFPIKESIKESRIIVKSKIVSNFSFCHFAKGFSKVVRYRCVNSWRSELRGLVSFSLFRIGAPVRPG